MIFIEYSNKKQLEHGCSYKYFREFFTTYIHGEKKYSYITYILKQITKLNLKDLNL